MKWFKIDILIDFLVITYNVDFDSNSPKTNDKNKIKI
jgi:hypothetical protein